MTDVCLPPWSPRPWPACRSPCRPARRPAHEAKTVGRYHFVVGFATNPPDAGEKNSVQLLLADAGDRPVTDLTNTLKVEVTTGGAEPLTLPMEPFFEVGEFGTPGDYRAFFIPTAPGSYSFHFSGTIKGQKVDQTFKSDPRSFSDIEDPAQVQHPVRQPTGGPTCGSSSTWSPTYARRPWSRP
jgi:hypothetical protein